MEPASTIVATVAALTQLLEQGTKGVQCLRSQLPEYERFWKKFKRELASEHDVPWSEIESACHLQPTFIGWAIHYIRGDDKARQAMEAHFEAVIEPPPGARGAKEEIVARVAQAATTAANEAAKTDRKAALANRELIASTIEKVVASIEVPVREVAEGEASTRQRVVELQQAVARIEEGLATAPGEGEDFREQVQQEVEHQRTASSGAPRSFDEGRVEQILKRATEGFAGQIDKALERHQLPAPESDPARSLLDRGPGLDATSQQEYLDQLRLDAPADATRLEQLAREGGTPRIAAAVRTAELADGSRELLVAVARIVAKDGFHEDSEQAHLQAARLGLDDCEKARQFVCAAHAANLQGATGRFRQHLKEARRLCPELIALAIAEARAHDDADDMLARLDGVESESQDEQGLVHQTRAQAYLVRGDEARAQEAFELARAASPDNVSVREFEAILPWLLAQRQMAAGEEPDREALLQAAARFRELAAAARRERRPDEAGHLCARAIEALVLAGQLNEAHRLLTDVEDLPVRTEDAAMSLGHAALIAQRIDLVLMFVPAESSSEEAQLLRAEAQALGDDPDARDEAIRALVNLLIASREATRARAAFVLLGVASTNAEVDWVDDAAAVLRASRPDLEVAMRAERAHILGDTPAAERLILPYAGRPQSLRRLRDYAAARGDWTAVADRSRTLIRRGGGTARDRLALAEAQDQLGKHDEALAAMLELARDSTADGEMREAAFGAAVQIAGANRDYTAIRDLAAEWLRAFPDSSDGRWNYAFGLARLQEHDEAHRVLDEAELEVSTVQQATLLAEVLYRADVSRSDALQRLIELSDQFKREVEALEALVIATALDARDAQLPPGVGDRIQDAMAHFEERFPESHALTQVPAPQGPEEFKALLQEMVGNRPVLQQQASDAVRDGRAPVNAFAALSPHSLAETWVQLIALPLAFCDETLDQADLDAASKALGSSAVCDSAALAVLSLLEEETRKPMMASLPGSLVTTETLEDAGDQSLVRTKPVATTIHDAEGNVGIEPVNQEDYDLRQERLSCILTLAKELEARPALGKGTSEELERLYDEGADAPILRAATASVMLAKRVGRPLYSDDRWMREFARQVDVPAFGTLALLDALTDHGVLAPALRHKSRLALAASHAWGVALTREELIEEAERAEFDLTPALTGAFHDRAAWRGRPADTCDRLGGFLGAVHQARPERLRIWVHRSIDAGTSAIPEMHASWISEVMLLMALGHFNDDGTLSDDTFQALLDEIKALPAYLTTLGYDPLMGALTQLLSYTGHLPTETRAQLFTLAVRRLRLGDQLRAMQSFVAGFPRLAA